MIAILMAAGALATSPNFVAPERLCNARGLTPASQTLLRPDDLRGVATPLNKLPKAHKELAVMRMVAGCAVPAGIRYDVEGDGRAAPGRVN